MSFNRSSNVGGCGLNVNQSGKKYYHFNPLNPNLTYQYSDLKIK